MKFEFENNEYLKDAIIRAVAVGKDTRKIDEANLYFSNLNENGIDIEFKINGVEFDFSALYKGMLDSMHSSIKNSADRQSKEDIKKDLMS